MPPPQPPSYNAARLPQAGDDPDNSGTTSGVAESNVRLAPGRMLKPGTSVLWRSAQAVQLELGDQRIIVENVASQALVAMLSPRFAAVSAPAQDYETCAEAIELRDGLEAMGFLTERPVTDAAMPARLIPELSGADGPNRPDEMVRARRRTRVAVHGTSRLAVMLASTLAAAGVGRIGLVDSGTVSATDAGPGGLLAADEGRRFAAAATEAVRRAAPETVVEVVTVSGRADLVVLADAGPVDSAARSILHDRRCAHLVVSGEGRRAVIGPLVVPGRTSCLRCADLHRTDRDPAWPLLAVQLANRNPKRIHTPVSLAVATAGLAASHALAFLDGQAPGSLGATVELELPDWRLRRRSWPIHSLCDCQLTAQPLGRKSRMEQ